MRVHAGVEKVSSLIHSVVVTTPIVHCLTPVADLLHVQEQDVKADAGYQGIAKSLQIAGTTMDITSAMRTCKCKALPELPEAIAEPLIVHPFLVINQRVGFHTT